MGGKLDAPSELAEEEGFQAEHKDLTIAPSDFSGLGRCALTLQRNEPWKRRKIQSIGATF